MVFHLCLLIALMLPALGFGDVIPFDRQEFPNYLSSVETSEIDKTLFHLLNQIEVPVWNSETEAVEWIRFFVDAQARASALSVTARVAPSAGVIRSLISHIANEMHMDMTQGRIKHPRETLQRIQSTNATYKFGITPLLGTSSDIDFQYFDTNPSAPDHFEILKQWLYKRSNNLKERIRMGNARKGYKKALLPEVDLNRYSTHVAESVAQGGSTLDFLAFDMVSQRTIEPPGLSIMADLKRGYIQYLPTAPNFELQDVFKQVNRMLRSLTELPSTTIEHPEEFIRQMQMYLTQTNARLSEKAKEQFEKLMRNSRAAGGNNRYWRGTKPSLEAHVAAYLEAIEAREGIKTIPEYVDILPLGRGEALPPELLIPIDQLITRYTDGGVIFHGTKEIVNVLSILRRLLIISGGQRGQGSSAKGTGAYASARKSLATNYAGTDGFAIPLDLNRDPRLKVADGARLKNHPIMETIATRFPGQDLNAVLRNHFGVDIVFDLHWMILNAAAILPPSDIRVLVQAIQANIGEHLKLPRRIYAFGLRRPAKALAEFLSLQMYSQLLQLPTMDVSSLSRDILDAIEIAYRQKGLSYTTIDILESYARIVGLSSASQSSERIEFLFQLSTEIIDSALGRRKIEILSAIVQSVPNLGITASEALNLIAELKLSFALGGKEIAQVAELVTDPIQKESLKSQLLELVETKMGPRYYSLRRSRGTLERLEILDLVEKHLLEPQLRNFIQQSEFMKIEPLLQNTGMVLSDADRLALQKAIEPHLAKKFVPSGVRRLQEYLANGPRSVVHRSTFIRGAIPLIPRIRPSTPASTPPQPTAPSCAAHIVSKPKSD